MYSDFAPALSNVRLSMQARDFCTTKVWDLPDGVLNMYKFSLVMHEGNAVLFGGMYVAGPQSKGNCSNSIIHVNLADLSYDHIKTQGALVPGAAVDALRGSGVLTCSCLHRLLCSHCEQRSRAVCLIRSNGLHSLLAPPER